MYTVNDQAPIKVHEESITAPEGIVAWLKQEAQNGPYTTLLAHALDGVIWGKVDRQGQLHYIHDFAAELGGSEALLITPKLDGSTLTEARLFSTEAELHIWHDAQGWRGCRKEVVGREQADLVESYTQEQMLWGDQAQVLGQSGFTLMQHGTQGLRHVVPLVARREDYDGIPPLRLQLRHYLSPDDEARVVLSRLVSLFENPTTEEKS